MILLSDIKNRLSASLRKFREEASEREAAIFNKLISEHHDIALDALTIGTATGHCEPILVSVKSLLGEVDTDLSELVKDGAVVHPDGTLLGNNKYEALDPEWTLALIKYLEYKDNKAKFGTNAQVINISDSATLAIAGDWGSGHWRGGDTPASKVAAQMAALAPDYTIHLGDVYYAGTESEETDNLIDIWPRGRIDQFALNSNHEMYCGGHFYFGAALPRTFPSQQGASYFALRNAHWLIIGLDTAYEATDLYLTGNLGKDTPQTQWLESLADKVAGHKVIVLSHHEPYDITGTIKTNIYDQVVQLLKRIPDYWYWGHLHNVIVYSPSSEGMVRRCVGHGSIPYGNASELKNAPNVVWYETELANDLEYKDRVLNGFIHLAVDGTTITERLIGENGGTRWRTN